MWAARNVSIIAVCVIPVKTGIHSYLRVPLFKRVICAALITKSLPRHPDQREGKCGVWKKRIILVVSPSVCVIPEPAFAKPLYFGGFVLQKHGIRYPFLRVLL
jgi:hypothetical protein